MLHFMYVTYSKYEKNSLITLKSHDFFKITWLRNKLYCCKLKEIGKGYRKRVAS